MANRLLGSLVVGLSLGFAACSGDNLTLPSEGEPAAIAVEGNTQTGRVGTELATPLTAVVTDTKSRPVAGATVEFEVTAGGGQVNPSSAVTGSDGRAATHLTLGSQVGTVSGVARVPVPAGRVPIQTTFTATAVSADANELALISGDNQTGQVGTKLGQPLVVKVTDGFLNPIAGMTVQWSVGTGGGSVSASSSQTDENGLASVERTLGPQAVDQTTIATAGGLAGSPITFHATANAGNVSSVVKISGDVGSAPAGTTVALVVEVRDADGNPISGAAVNWVVGVGGSVTPLNNTTGSDGRAGAQWTLGSAPGTNTLTAVSGGATATFTITGTGTGSPSTLALIVQPTDVTVGMVISPAPLVQIKDASGNNVAIGGVEITVAKSAGGGSLQGTQTVTTDGSGQAQFGDLRITGATGTGRRLIFSADGYRSVTSASFKVNKASTTTTITSDNPDPSDPQQQVTVTFKVDWPAAAGTPTGRVDVDFTDGEGAHCDGPIDGTGNGSCQVTLTTTGPRNLVATYRGDVLFLGSVSDGVSHTVNPPNPAPVANDDAYTAAAGATLTVNAPGVLANDTDDSGDIMTAHVVTGVTNGELQFDPSGSGAFTYTPAPGATLDTFTYNVTDLHGNTSNTATVIITIQP